MKENIIIDRTRISVVVIMFFVLVGIAAVMAVALVLRDAERRQNKEYANWENSIRIIANVRADAVTNWVRLKKSDVKAVADNTSFRLYLTDYLDAIKEKRPTDPDDSAQLTYMRNYLMAVAERSGFVSKKSPNQITNGDAGIYLLGEDGKPIISTSGSPEIDEDIKGFIRGVPKGKQGLKDLYLAKDGKTMIAFIAPVFAVQGDEIAESQIGYVLGITSVDDALFGLLNHPETVEKFQRSVLIREAGGVVEYISPFNVNNQTILPFTKKVNLDREGYDAAFVLKNPTKFGRELRDLNNVKVMSMGIRIPETNWMLLHNVDFREAMQVSEEIRRNFLFMTLLGIGLVVVLVFAAWRNGASIRVAEAASKYKKLAEDYSAKANLHKLISSHQPDGMLLVDQELNVKYANDEAARAGGQKPEDANGKTLKQLFGTESDDYESIVKHSLINALSKTENTLRKVKRNDGEKYIFTRSVRLDDMQEFFPGTNNRGVLLVEQDITSAIIEKEKRERVLSQIVDSLVTAVDKRDPYSAQHSTRVGMLSEAVAKQLGLDEIMVETTAMAGRLMNLGKILLPRDVLTKTGTLTESEKRQISEAVSQSAEIVNNIEFRGPVVETLRQVQEKFDGSGPLKLSGEDILISARILSTVNAFVALTSERSYRHRMNESDAIEELLKNINGQYQRKIVVALANYLENKA